jgi:hypothetical protein
MKILLLITAFVVPTLLIGCTNNAERLGEHVAKLRNEQIYNPDAAQDNLGVIPLGSGERMEGAYQVYTGKEPQDLSSSDSQFIEGFSN